MLGTFLSACSCDCYNFKKLKVVPITNKLCSL
uniref:Uncharacterized protein n=1 Tax=Anguilla anguilla TaxID=7936 RepID=A0A0E9U9C8_ANGAN